MGPRTVAIKAKRKIGRDSKRWVTLLRDRFISTYAQAPAVSPCSLLTAPSTPSDLRHVRIVSADFKSHRFDLLGSGWQTVAFGLECKGFEGHRYGPGPKVKADPSGDWLHGRVSSPNLPDARRSWQMISPGYVPIDWQMDFKSGYRWDALARFDSIRFGHLPGADVKVPWELCRMQHLVQFAWVFSGSGVSLEERTACQQEFQDQVLDFLSTNPPRYGIHWNCPMEVGIRISNILFAYDIFRASGAQFRAEFETALVRAALDHGRHIMNHLEWVPEGRGNHYLANLTGLIVAGCYLSELPEARQWIAFAEKELLREFKSQFADDGSNFEASTCYHALSCEMIAVATAVLLAHKRSKRETLAVPDWFVGRLGKAIQFLQDVSESNRVMQIGDNDSGRFLKLAPVWKAALDGTLCEDPLNVESVLAAYSSLLSLPNTKLSDNGRLVGDFFLQLGGTSFSLQNAPSARTAFVAYPDFGIFIYRMGEWKVTIRCGPVGQNGNGGHAHNDQLSIEIVRRDVPFIVDPGTYIYTASRPSRDKFRSTAMHNTLSSHREQNEWQTGAAGFFSMKGPISEPSVIEATERRFVGEHRRGGEVHRRTIVFNAVAVTVHDSLQPASPCQVNLHPHPDVLVTVNGAKAMLSQGAHQITVSASASVWTEVPAGYSEGYGLKQDAAAIVLPVQGDVTWELSLS
jgi:hypothetical protein